MTTSARLRTEASDLEKRAQALLQKAKVLRQAAEQLDAVGGAAGIRRINRQALQSGSIDRTIPDEEMDVDTTGQPLSVRMGAGRATRKHPAQARLYVKGQTISSIADELDEKRSRVSAWFAVGEANRPIPGRHAEYLEKKYGIPRSAWARIAD